jgi:hypothetical protein
MNAYTNLQTKEFENDCKKRKTILEINENKQNN